MLFALGRATTIVALCLSLGLHWFALQSVAWTTMLVANARRAPLSEAVTRTFDGSHPCDLCDVVSAGKKSEKKSEVLPTSAKMDLICTTRRVLCSPPWTDYDFAALRFSLVERTLAPPAPPPRGILA